MNSKFLFAIPLCAVSSSAFAVYGHNQLDASVFNWVGGVGGGGSGTVISPHFVLTAKHVGGTSFFLNGDTFNAVQRIDHPTADISLLRFTDTFDNYSLPWFDDAMGQVLTFVGFGGTATERADWTGYNEAGGGGARRAATNRIEAQEDVAYFEGGPTTRSLIADLDFYNPNTPAPFQVDRLGGGGAVDNEGGIFFGDSGGGSLINVGGQWRIAGVNIWIGDGEAPFDTSNNDYLDYGDYFGTASVSFYRDWIVANAPETVPEPATIAALGLGALALLKRRRK
jgi:hypothetical protein